MKKKKLSLSRETLRTLGAGQMAPVAGASGCPSCPDYTCGSCYETCTYCSYSCGATCEPNTCPCI